MAVVLTRRRFTTDEYRRMAEAGILTEDDRVELVRGEIIEMPPIGSIHAGRVNRVSALFAARLGSRAVISVQNPIQLSDDSEPLPDIAVLRPRPDFYERSHPTPADTLLIVEVGGSLVDYDRRVKAPLYARARIPELWLADVAADCLEVHQGPARDGYRDLRVRRRGESVIIGAFPDVSFSVDELLGGARH